MRKDQLLKDNEDILNKYTVGDIYYSIYEDQLPKKVVISELKVVFKKYSSASQWSSPEIYGLDLLVSIKDYDSESSVKTFVLNDKVSFIPFLSKSEEKAIEDYNWNINNKIINKKQELELSIKLLQSRFLDSKTQLKINFKQKN